MDIETKINAISIIFAIFITAILVSCCISFGVIPTLIAILILIAIFIAFIVTYGITYTIISKIYAEYKEYKNNKEDNI